MTSPQKGRLPFGARLALPQVADYAVSLNRRISRSVEELLWKQTPDETYWPLIRSVIAIRLRGTP